MSIIKSTSYAPDIYRSLNGILLVHKQQKYSLNELTEELKERICDSLNSFEPRPLSRRLVITGPHGEEKQVVDVPNLADHPLVVGPRYLPKELSIRPVPPYLGYRSSGLNVFTIGKAHRLYNKRLYMARLPNVYHVCGEFGFKTHNYFHDGNILDKANYNKIQSGRMDSILAKIESSQRDRLFDASRVPIHSQEAYELAKSWPSRPARMAMWPVIFRIRCIHLELPHFKLEITVINESETFLAHVVNDVGIMLRSGAFTNSIRRVKYGPFNIDDSLIEKEWNIQSIVDNLKMNHDRLQEIDRLLRSAKRSTSVQTRYDVRRAQESEACSG